MVRQKKKRFSWGRWTVAAGFLLLTLILLFSLGVFDGLVRAQSGPDIEVTSSFSGKPLLGGTATLSVTMTNIGDERGYNISLEQVFSSNLVEPDGQVTFVSAFLDSTIGGGPISPNSTQRDPVTGNLILFFDNFTDLEPGEAATLRITVSLAEDPTWEVEDLVISESSAKLYEFPDGSGEPKTDSDTTQAEVIPIALVTKSANQSTGVEQATGTLERVYRYTLEVQNNYKEQTDDVVVVDTLPDGLEFLGVVDGPAPNDIERDLATGITTLTWNLGDLPAATPGDEPSWTVTYEAGIRYDYYGTENGGENREHDDFAETTDLGDPIINKTEFENIANLFSKFQGKPYTDQDTATVTGAYATINKSVNTSTVGNKEIVTYTIVLSTSEYYQISNIEVVDVLSDGQTYEVGSASIEPDLVEYDTPEVGETRITWNTSIENALTDGILGVHDAYEISFRAEIDDVWEDPELGNKIGRAHV